MNVEIIIVKGFGSSKSLLLKGPLYHSSTLKENKASIFLDINIVITIFNLIRELFAVNIFYTN